MYILSFALAILLLCQVSSSDGYSARRLFRQWLRSQHEDAPKPDVEDLTCWTCNNQTDNEACNNWAPDVQCPVGHSVCKLINEHKVTKLCDGCLWETGHGVLYSLYHYM